MHERPRVLLVTRNLPPLVGGMERLNWHIADELKAVADVCIVGPEGAAGMAPPGCRVLEVRASPAWRFLGHAARAAFREARAWRPDIVLAGSGLTAPLALMAARNCGGKAMAYVHGLDVAVANQVYRALWWPSLRRMARVVANSRATAVACEALGLPRGRIGIVHPGVALPEPAKPGAVERFLAEHGLRGRRVLLSVGRLTERKGLREFVTGALPAIIAAAPDAVLLVIGEAPSQALYARAQAPEDIREAAIAAGVGDHVRFLGVMTDYGQLGTAYRAAHVHVFPVRDLPADPEGFGMVAIEAAAHGLPTVAFATGGVPDAVEDGVSGHLVPVGDYGAFSRAVIGVLATLKPGSDGCREFAARFAWSRFGPRLVAELGLDATGGTPG